MKHTIDIPFPSICTIELFVNKFRYSITQVAAQAQAKRPDCKVYVVTGGMWNADGSACVGLKVGGRLLSRTPWGNVYGSLDGSYRECDFTQKLYPGQEHLLKITCSLLNKGGDAYCLILTH